MTARMAAPSGVGNVKSGLGTVKVGNGVFEGAYSYGSRFGEVEETNPERLIAAVQATCFTMVVSSI
jgi:lipoyl-dependent peroxiredoxin